MVVGILSLIQKGQTRGHSGCSTQYAVDAVDSGIWYWTQWTQYAVHSRILVYGGRDIVFHAKRSNQSMQWMQYAVDTVHSGRSRIVVYGTVNIVFDAKRSNQWIQWVQSHSGHSTQWMQWMQYTVDAVHSGCSRIVVYGGGTLSLIPKGQTRGRSGCSTQWTQYAVRSGCSRIVVYGTGNIVFDAKGQTSGFSGCSHTVDTVHSGCSGRSMQWMQWNSGIWWWGHCLWCKKVKPENAVDAVCSTQYTVELWYMVVGALSLIQKRQTSGFSACSHTVDTVHSGCSRIVVYGSGDIVFDTKRSNQRTQWMQYAVDAVE